MSARDPIVDTIHPFRRALRTWISRLLARAFCRALFRPSLVGRDRLPAGPAIYCSNHLSWIDPFVVMATLPMRPRLMFFGPKEEDMSVGGRNRLMQWTGATIPYRPGKNDLLDATRRVHAAVAAGRVVVIFGEGRIQPFESHLRPLSEGAAYFALRAESRWFRSRSTGRHGCGSGGGSRSRSAMRSPPTAGRRVRPSTS